MLRDLPRSRRNLDKTPLASMWLQASVYDPSGIAADAFSSYNQKQFTRKMLSIAVPASVKEFRTSGYSSPYDDGDARYRRVSSEPIHAVQMRTADRLLPSGSIDAIDGGWWEIANRTLKFKQFGAVGDGIVDDTSAVNNCWAAAASLRRHNIFLNDGSGAGPIFVDQNTCISFSGEGQVTALIGRGANVAAGDLVLGTNTTIGTTSDVGSSSDIAYWDCKG